MSSAIESSQGAVSRLLAFLVPRIYKNVPSGESAERALRAVSGQLGHNPPGVEASFLVSDDSAQTALDAAISPMGTVGILCGPALVPCDVKSIDVTVKTWSRGGGFKEVASVSIAGKTGKKRFLFPPGSETPALLLDDGQIVWGDWTVTLAGNRDAHLILWEEGGTRFVAYIREERLCVHQRVTATGLEMRPTDPLKALAAKWIGLANGEPAMIVTLDDGSTELRWNGTRSNRMGAGENVVIESIGFVEDRIQFVTRRQDCTRTAWRMSKEAMSSDAFPKDGYPLYDRGEIFAICSSASGWAQLHRFTKRGFEPFGREFVTNGRRDGHWHLDAFKNAVVLSADVGSHSGGISRACIAMVRADGQTNEWYAKDVVAMRHVAEGFVELCTETAGQPSLLWHSPDERSGFSIPNYQQSLDSHVRVNDARGGSLMSWFSLDNTFHVLRYPLPAKK